MPTSGVDFPSKKNVAVMVGVPGTNNFSHTSTAEQVVVRRGNDWYAIYFNRYYFEYTGSQYVYFDKDWYGVKIGEGPNKPQAQNTSRGPRYDHLIKQGAARVTLTDSQVESYGIKRPWRLEIRTSPKELGWSASEGAAARDEGWDPRALIPSSSREPGQTGTVENSGGTTKSSDAQEENDPVTLTVFGPPRFNPPLISYASGAWKKPGDSPGDRSRIVGPDSDSLRVRQRGVFIQDLTHAGDWKITTEDTPQTSNDSVDAFNRVRNYSRAVTEPDDPEDRGFSVTQLGQELAGLLEGEARWQKNQSLLLDNRTYGFRFHYNPSTISMSAGVATGVNPALIISERTTWTPITPPENPATIGLSLYLNRIEDMSFFKKTNGGYQWATTQRQGVYDGRVPSEKEIEGIMTRGTEYDLEFLFRTVLGRPFPTLLRGYTADIGLIWGTPVQLWLSRSMRYKGRVTGLSWSHRSFNRFMVPMWTEVNIQFTRYPDAISAADTEGAAVTDGYTYNKVMGYEVFDSAWAGAEGRDGSGGRR